MKVRRDTFYSTTTSTHECTFGVLLGATFVGVDNEARTEIIDRNGGLDAATPCGVALLERSVWALV